MKVSDALADAVYEEGVRSVFGLMGDANMFFLERLRQRPDVVIYDVRHEGSAVTMADGYARASGRVGVATVTCGPGVTQLGTSLTVASKHGSSVVVVGGDVSTAAKGMGGRQDIDQRRFVEACGALFHQLRSPGSVAADLQHCFALARSSKRPVFFSCPADIQDRDHVGDLSYVTSDALVAVREPMIATPRAIEESADMIVGARRPVIIAGAGAIASDARTAIDALGDRIGAALATTLRSKGYLDGHWSVGICGTYSTIPGQSILSAADLVILVGASGSPETFAAIPASARILQIDLDGTTTLPGRRPDLLVRGDARAALEAIEALLREAGYQAVGFRGGVYEELFLTDAVEADLVAADWKISDGVVDPRRVVRELDTLLPRDCVVVIGSSHFSGFPSVFLNGYRSRRFFNTYDLGCIGQGLPSAIGVSAALPDLPVVLFEGDASLMMHIHEMDTTARYRPRLLVFVMNDGRLGAEYHRLRSRGIDPEGASIRTPDFGAVAVAFGNTGGRVTSLPDLEREVSAFVADERPRYVDVRVDANVISPSYRDQFPSLRVARRDAPGYVASDLARA